MTGDLSDADGDATGTVLVVEDEERLADLYTDYLSGTYNVRTAYGGVEAVDALSHGIDVAVIPRRMPVISGEEVIAGIEERGIQCRVAMVTETDPEFDVVDLGCDDYVVEPVGREELLGVVDRLLKLSQYNDLMRDLTAKKLKRNVLRVENSAAELENSREFRRLRDEIAETESRLDDIASEIGSDYLDRAH